MIEQMLLPLKKGKHLLFLAKKNYPNLVKINVGPIEFMLATHPYTAQQILSEDVTTFEKVS